MFDRVFTTIVIMSVIACPLRCGEGVCLENHHGGISQQSITPSCCLARHCCSQKSGENSREDAPSKCPDNSSCQGVCSGAVFEKPFELGEPVETLATSTPVDNCVNATLTSRVYDSRPPAANRFVTESSGRGVRLVYMSLVC